MSSLFANEQGPGFRNHVENVAIVGIGGRSGAFMADALIQGRKHRVTAITRPESSNKIPSEVHDVKSVDYSNHAALVEALRGQDVLIITMAVMAPKESQIRLVDAAVEAGVKYIMPNEWGVDLSKLEMSKDTMMADRYFPVREHIEKVGAGKTHWIGLCCGFWYEFSLAGTDARYGFDFDKKAVTMYNDGNTKINTSTWPQVGRAVASLLSMKILPENSQDNSSCLNHYNNKAVHVSSFFVSQRDMFDSVLRVTGDKEEDWTVSQEDVVERYKRGHQILKEGRMVGFAIVLYARIFYPDSAGNFDDKLDNDVLGLPKEDIDDATKVAVRMAHAGETNAVH